MLIEQIVIDHLKSELKIDDVYAEVPEIAPDSFVLITVIDRRKKNFIDSITMEFHSYAPSKAEAAALDTSVRKSVERLISRDDISSCRLGGGDDDPDVWLNKYKYRSYYNIVYYDD